MEGRLGEDSDYKPQSSEVRLRHGPLPFWSNVEKLYKIKVGESTFQMLHTFSVYQTIM